MACAAADVGAIAPTVSAVTRATTGAIGIRLPNSVVLRGGMGEKRSQRQYAF
jgi:hypothetical protein